MARRKVNASFVSVWMHDKPRKRFFRLKYGKITHCYRFEYREDESCGDHNCWWQVPVPHLCWAQYRKLELVPNFSEISYQLERVRDAEFPPAGWFLRRNYPLHPRYNQWSELIPLAQKRENWGSHHTPPRPIDFESFPYHPDKSPQ